MRPLSRILVPALALAAACAPATGAGPASDSRVDLATITRQEAEAASTGTAYDLVQTRRPNWLVAGNASGGRNPSGGPVQVYFNNTRLGGPQELRAIAAADVGSIRFYDPPAANLHFGNGHLNGVIQVLPAGSATTHP